MTNNLDSIYMLLMLRNVPLILYSKLQKNKIKNEAIKKEKMIRNQW